MKISKWMQFPWGCFPGCLFLVLVAVTLGAGVVVVDYLGEEMPLLLSVWGIVAGLLAIFLVAVTLAILRKVTGGGGGDDGGGGGYSPSPGDAGRYGGLSRKQFHRGINQELNRARERR